MTPECKKKNRMYRMKRIKEMNRMYRMKRIIKKEHPVYLKNPVNPVKEFSLEGVARQEENR
jgi:hypothetical protein